MLENKKKYPRCIGYYSRKDIQCDGDRQGDSAVDRMPCVMRDRCVALRRHCESNSLRVSNYMKRERILDDDGDRRTYCFTYLEDEDLRIMLNKTIEAWGIINGRITRKEPATIEVKSKKRKKANTLRNTRPVSEATKKKITKAKKSSDNDALDRARELCMRFVDRLSRLSDRKVSNSKNSSIGDLVVIDRMKNSRYISIYLEASKHRRIAVAVVCPSIRTRRVEIRIAAPLEHFKKTEIDKLFLIDFSDGKFIVKTGKIDIEGMAIVAEIICRFMREGIIGATSDSSLKKASEGG